MKSKPKTTYKLWVSVLGAGFSPWASGTCGSAVAAAAFYLTASHAGSRAAFSLMAVLALAGAVITLVFGRKAIRDYGPDPSVIVSDELCGQALTYLYFWNAASSKNCLYITVAGFLLFRFFDILKPPPVRQLEKLPHVWGVLFDDIMAGIYAWAVLVIFYSFLLQ